MGAVCSAFAYAMELSERTLAATAALMGAARLALISDICSRSGSCSPSCASSSSSVRPGLLSVIGSSSQWDVSVRLVDGRLLQRVGVGDGAVRQHVRGD